MKEAGLAPAFFIAEMRSQRSCGMAENKFPNGRNLFLRSSIVIEPFAGFTDMRIPTLALLFSLIAAPCLAQTILKSEPLVLAPYEIAFVQDVSCPAGRVLKVTGAIRGLHRKKACVLMAAEQASLAVATP
jgi:hypothetical protein